MKKILNFVILIVFSLALAGGLSPAFAAEDNTGAYGKPCDGGYGSNNCFTNIVVIKNVQNPTTLEYVENLGANKDRFNPGQEIKFQIKVTNTGNTNLENIEVKDTLPPYIEFVTGFGKFDANTKVLTLIISKLEVNETKKLDLTARIVNANKLPGDQGVVCTVNYVSAQSSGNMSEDNSQFCIQKKVLGVTAPPVLPAPKIVATPATGAEMLPLLGLIPGALGGLMLRKKSNKINFNDEGGEK